MRLKQLDLYEVCMVEERDARHALVPSVRRVRHRWKRKLVAALFVALLSPWCCVCIRLTYSASYFANILTTLLPYVQHFRLFLFQYSGRFSELLNALVNCMIYNMNSNSIALTSDRFIGRVFTILYMPCVFRFTDCRP